MKHLLECLRQLSKAIATLAMTCLLVTPVVRAQSQDAGFDVVNDAALIETQRINFNQSLARLGFPRAIQTCKMVVRLLPLDGDPTYGAVCQLEGPKPQSVLLCDDTMVGKFTMKAWGFGESIANVAAFTEANCPKGG